MPRKKPYEDETKSMIISGNYINGVNIIRDLPPQDQVRLALENSFKVCSDRGFKVILVEDCRDYQVFIQIPGEKSECDFFVWRRRGDEIKIPTHDDLGETFIDLKKTSQTVDEHLINAVIKLVRDRWSVDKIINKYFSQEPEPNKLEITKFLSTLKWIALQEDTNYPPPRYLGSRYTLAVYALLEVGFDIKAIRRIIKF